MNMESHENIVDGIYQIIGEIGEGGGGKVYLAEHLRLNKKVVLKLIKNSHKLSDKSLRREVDALKNLHHSYIPQVYDFVSNSEMTYTVMDYIEGESLDNHLARKEKFEQARIIKWLKQLLEAVDYLHKIPPNGILHADIKPANIMINQNDDVQLIDFNIALALGDEGAVAVGRSAGYASPEHYGIDYRTPTVDYSTVHSNNSSSKSASSYTETILTATEDMTVRKKILLDKRSDIYSIGATMYHLLYGKKPGKDINEKMDSVSSSDYSLNLINIIKKAMNSNPDLRYQSVEEMLNAVRNLRNRDSRLIRLRHSFYFSIVCSSILLFSGIGMVSLALKQSENLKNAYYMAEKSSALLERGDVSGAIGTALSVLPEKTDIFNPKIVTPAIKALTDATGIYDLTEGFKKYGLVDVKSETISAFMTEDGRYSAIKVSSSVLILDNAEKEIVKSLEADRSAFSDMCFLDNEHLLYAATEGICLYDIKNNQAVWDKKAGNRFGLSNNKKFFVSVLNDEKKAYIYTTKDGNLVKEVELEAGLWLPKNHQFLNSGGIILSINDTGDKLAFSFEDGRVLIKDRDNKNLDIELLSKESGYSYFTGGFYKEFFAFTATKEKESIFSVIDLKQVKATGGFQSELMFLSKTDKDGIYLSNDNILVQIDPITGEQKALVDLSERIEGFVRSNHYLFVNSDNAYYIFDSQVRQINRYKKKKKDEIMAISDTYALLAGTDHPYVQLFSKEKNTGYISNDEFIYNKEYQHDEARVNSDETSILLYDVSKLRIIDKNGVLLREAEIEKRENIGIVDQQYVRMEGGDQLKIIYNDGKVVYYDAKDASMTQGEDETVDKEITDWFETEEYLVKAPLHGAVQVYDKNNKFIKELSNEDYLTYITEVGDYIIAEYVKSDVERERYGILMNKKLETLAYLPQLTDILNGRLYFDDRYEKIKSLPIYSLDEIKQRAFEIIGNHN